MTLPLLSLITHEAPPIPDDSDHDAATLHFKKSTIGAFQPCLSGPETGREGGEAGSKRFFQTPEHCGLSRYAIIPRTENGVTARRCTRRKRLNKTVAHGGDALVTLSLLPEIPGQSAFTDTKLSVASAEKQKRQGPFWLSFSDGGGMITPTYQSVEVMRRTVVISSCMTVERVTDAWNDGYGLGRSDEERKMNLVRDTCPGFISDGSGRVTWTNEAYMKMARDNIRVKEGAPENKSGDSFHVIVRLVMRERPMLTYTAFTCRVTLQFTCQDRERCSVTVPCDVWRMDDGGFAWKLDVKAALCL
ncbi:hypothetical protein F2Q68_00004309 [Brassica cretica]|uniref:DUF7950 domain-containing protein n=2 Tax=Brassica cretica TaxID=69181 RepID=A0A8S9JEV8_BRACR|nr:hypothetical protein F2Q68_00004309 [Brassica cretica]